MRQERRKLTEKATRKPGFPLALLIIIFSAFLRSAEGASGSAVLFGVIRDGREAPLPGLRAELTSADSSFHVSTVSNSQGFFEFCGIPPGEINVVIELSGRRLYEQRQILVWPGARLYLRIRVPSEGETGSALGELTDLSPVTGRTIITEFQVKSMPSADNVWSLLENQDLSATTDRIDVGGVWASLPALWSSRGGVSWTQSVYLLNGLNVTDPYSTGLPLFYPDIYSLGFTEQSDGRHPIQYLAPGGTFNLIPKQGTPQWHGAVSASFTPGGLTTTNISSRLLKENLTESTRLNSLENYAAQVSGPIVPQKLLMLASFNELNVSRDVAQFAPDDKSSVSSGLVNLTYLRPRSSLQFLWTGQVVRHPTYGAARNVPESATLDRRSLFHVVQIFWRTSPGPKNSFELGAGFNSSSIRSQFQNGVTEPHGEEVFKKIPVGAAAFAGRDIRDSLTLSGHGTALFNILAKQRHQLEYGLALRYASSSSKEDILDNIHLHFVGTNPFEIVRYNTPLTHRERSLDLHLYAQDTILFPNLASLSVGLHLVKTRGWVPTERPTSRTPMAYFPAPPGEGGRIDWLQLSPRLEFSIPLVHNKSLIFRVSAARYYFDLPLSYLVYGNPQALGGLAYRWNDLNHDGQFQEEEAGELWRREGPYFSEIDANLNRPLTDEYSVSISKMYRGNLYLSLAGYLRETRHLVETLNTGVPLGAYDPFTLYDPGDDTIPGNHDDLYFKVYNQKEETLGQDFFLLTNPEAESRVSRYRGLDLTLVKKFSRRVVLFLSGTATEAIGTTSPGNTAQENDDGVIGALYDNPNASIRARGRLRFDRAYTARLGVSLPAPLGFRLAALVKYYDGQPFARKIIITGLNQGPFYIQAHYRGQARYEFNMTVDIRLEKIFGIGRGRGRIFLDGYNIFNWAMATQENEWTGPDFTLRFATEVVSPRVFRVGLAYEF
jgi:hypothetical protein